MDTTPTVLDMDKFDVTDLTINELETIEGLAGEPFDEFFGRLGEQGASKIKAFKILVFILTKRDNPDFTMEDAGNVRLDFGNMEVPDPKALRSPNGNGNTRRKAKKHD